MGLKAFYMSIKIITTISLLSLDAYGMIHGNYPGYAIMNGAVLGLCMYHIWFDGLRGEIENKQSGLLQEMVGKKSGSGQ